MYFEHIHSPPPTHLPSHTTASPPLFLLGKTMEFDLFDSVVLGLEPALACG